MVKDHIEKMQELNSDVSTSVKMYGKFLICVLNDFDEGIDHV